MPAPLVLAEAGVEITASLLTASSPAPVQVLVSGVGAGVGYVITGSVGGFEWVVNAGDGVGDGGQIVLIDTKTPINVPIVYSVTVGGFEFTADPVTVTVGAGFIFQTLGGFVSIPLVVEDHTFDRDWGTRATVFQIPNRNRPVVRFDSLTDGTGSLKVTTDAASTETLVEVLRAGGPIMWRQSGGVRDLALVETFVVTGLKSTSPIDALRQWDITYTLVDDPEPGVASVAFSWDTFDTVYAGSTWDDFDAEWSTLTWADFDRYDWGMRL